MQPLVFCWVACAVLWPTKPGYFDIPDIPVRRPKWRPHIFLQGLAGACALSAFTASASCMNASFSWMRLMLFCVVTFSFVVAGCGAVLRCGIFSKDFEKIFF